LSEPEARGRVTSRVPSPTVMAPFDGRHAVSGTH